VHLYGIDYVLSNGGMTLAFQGQGQVKVIAYVTRCELTISVN